MFIESSDSKLLGYYFCKEEIDLLMGSLNPKGEERGLFKSRWRKTTAEYARNSRIDQRIWLTGLRWRRLCREDLLVFGRYQERILLMLSSVMSTSGKKTNLVSQLYWKARSLVEFSIGPIRIF